MVSPSMTRATFASFSPHGGPAHAAASASVVTASVFGIVRGRRARTAPSQHIPSDRGRAQQAGVILGNRAIWAGFDGVVTPLQRGILTVLDSETPCEKLPVPARS